MDQEGTGIRSQNDNVNCTIDTPSRDVIPESVEGEASEDGVSLKAEIESFEANPLIQNNVGKSNEGTAQDAVAGVMLGGDVQRFNIIPRCVLNCAHWRVLEHGCAYSDHTCFCQQIGPVLYEPAVQACIEECQFLGEQAYAKGSIIEYCQHDEHHIKFPPYMLHYKDLFRRQTSGGAGEIAAPQTTLTTTITSTLPWGIAATTYTQNGAGTVTVVDYISDTQVLTSFFQTTTLSPGIAPFTSTFTDPKSAAITVVRGVISSSTTGSTSSPSSSSSSSLLGPSPSPPTTDSNPKPTATSSSSGLSTGAKVGIGVSIPMLCVLLALGILLFLRRRKRQKKISVSTMMPEKNDGGLPELTSTLHNSKAQEVGGIPIHEMHADAGRAGPHGDYTNPPSELHDNQTNPSHELHSNQTTPSHELTTTPMHQDRFPPPSSVAKEPVAITSPSSSFPPPWENSSNNEFTPPHPIEDQIDQDNEAAELARLREEMARVKQRKERLQQLQDLEAREEELERSIQQRTKGGSSKA
ncbi:hypothetical protein BDZ45DRAFT_677497 [Acephala macrosclerotiorum]|nr:hypothetical protein BDZ45DRAFT_677497 [Acephala macrosclerotiorum]